MDDIASGWHSRGYLPHFDAPGVVQTGVFRLVDSLPRHLVTSRRATAETALEFDGGLDEGTGACWLKRPDIAAEVENALLHFDGERYFLLAWCVMPNHVHVMVEMRTGFRFGDQVRSWKTFTARRANERLHRRGPFWSADYFDRYIRGDRHYDIALNYIEHNPVKAGLVSRPELWRWSSARRR
jgi:REP element-mobilizing transposase RayT